jgi:tetratricopeptide (TPR) repeat protein
MPRGTRSGKGDEGVGVRPMLKSAGVYLLVLALSSAVWLSAQSPVVSAELPQLTISEFPPETQKQVEQAFAAAHEHLNDAEAIGKLGMLLDVYHRTDDAALCYRRAHLLVPTSFKWVYYLGSLLFNQKKMQDAVPVLSAALNLQPKYLPAKLKLGEALLDTGEIEAAAEIYEGILKDDPDTAEAYYGLGRVQSARGDRSAAADQYRKACDLFPNYGAAHYELALAYHKLGRLSDAKEQLELRNRNPNIVPPVADPLRDELRDLDRSAMDHLERGMLLEQVGRLEDAIAESEKALELNPSIVKAHVNLVILYGRVGNASKAEEHYKAIVAVAPNDFPEAYYNYGVLLLKQQNFDGAEKAFRKALALGLSSEGALSNLGYVLEQEGKLSEAALQFGKLIDLHPTREAHFELGRILVNQQQYQGAIAQFQQTLVPEDDKTPAYLYALGATYGRAGDKVQAIRYLEQAKQLATSRGQTALVKEINQDLEQVEASSK